MVVGMPTNWHEIIDLKKLVHECLGEWKINELVHESMNQAMIQSLNGWISNDTMNEPMNGWINEHMNSTNQPTNKLPAYKYKPTTKHS